jgi:hypothetical protein
MSYKSVRWASMELEKVQPDPNSFVFKVTFCELKEQLSFFISVPKTI